MVFEQSDKIFKLKVIMSRSKVKITSQCRVARMLCIENMKQFAYIVSNPINEPNKIFNMKVIIIKVRDQKVKMTSQCTSLMLG